MLSSLQLTPPFGPMPSNDDYRSSCVTGVASATSGGTGQIGVVKRKRDVAKSNQKEEYTIIFQKKRH